MHQSIKMPLVAILRGITAEEIDSHIPPLLEAGFEAIEIPLNSPQWPLSLARAVASYGNKAIIGGGTVTDPGEVEKLAGLGCRLIVSPNCCPEVIRAALRHNMQALPGCFTATEVFAAIKAGASQIKLFPAALFGPGYIQALKSVLPADIAIWAVGGVTPENMAAFLQAGCTGVGLGSDLYRAGQSATQTAARAAAFVQAWRRHQKEAV